jgi:CRISPR/Cas system-associated endonuclease/helicase Cas3
MDNNKEADQKQDMIDTFVAMTESHDYGVAMEYLEKNEWDLSKAVDQFINTHNFREDNNPSNAEINQHHFSIPPGNSKYQFSSFFVLFIIFVS